MAGVVLVRANGDRRPAARPTSTAGAGVRVCAVSGSPGPDGARFRAPVARALRSARRELAVSTELEAVTGPQEFAAALERFGAGGCDLVIAVGSEAPAATDAVAGDHPDTHFAVLGASGLSDRPNVLAVRFHPEQAAVLAGYVACAVSTTGIVGAFGGARTPQVEAVLDGFAAGVQRCRKDDVGVGRLLGWQPDTMTGRFARSPDDVEGGRTAGQRLVTYGADVVFAAAGRAGRGAAEVAIGVGDVAMVGFGTDQGATAHVPDVWLASVQEHASAMVRLLIDLEVGGSFRPGVVEATMANGGVGLSALRGTAGSVSLAVQYKLGVLRDGLAAETVPTTPSPPASPAPTATPAPTPGVPTPDAS